MKSFAACALDVHMTTTMSGRRLSIGEASNSRVGWEASAARGTYPNIFYSKL